MANYQYLLSVKKSIPAGTKQVFNFPIDVDSSVERIRVHFNPGPEGSLQVTPEIIQRDGTPRPLFRVPDGADPYLSGDNMTVESADSIGLISGDTIRVTADNTDAANAHTLDVTMTIDTLGGQKRVI